LTTDTSSNQPPYSQFWFRVDGGPFTKYTLSAGNPVITVAEGLVSRKHLLEVVIKSTSETVDRWVKQRTAIVFTGILLDNGRDRCSTAPQAIQHSRLWGQHYGGCARQRLRRHGE
jgi:hypothetical protein